MPNAASKLWIMVPDESLLPTTGYRVSFNLKLLLVIHIRFMLWIQTLHLIALCIWLKFYYFHTWIHILKNSYIKPIHYWNERNLIAAVLVDAAAISWLNGVVTGWVDLFNSVDFNDFNLDWLTEINQISINELKPKLN